MNNITYKTPCLTSVFRWLARILSIISIGLVIMLAFGEGLNPLQLTLREWVLFLFLLGICLGMIVAWRWEGWGGCITVGSLAAFYLAHRIFSPGFPRGLAFVAIAVSGFLFLLCRLWTCSKERELTSSVFRISLAECLLAGGLICTVMAAGLCQFVMVGLIGMLLFPAALALFIAAGIKARSDDISLQQKNMGLVLYAAGMILLFAMAGYASSLVYELAMSMSNPTHFVPALIKWKSTGGFSVAAGVFMALGLWLRTGWPITRCVLWGLAALCVCPLAVMIFWILFKLFYFPITA